MKIVSVCLTPHFTPSRVLKSTLTAEDEAKLVTTIFAFYDALILTGMEMAWDVSAWLFTRLRVISVASFLHCHFSDTQVETIFIRKFYLMLH